LQFRPEFLNRIDEIVVFRSLTKEQLLEIVDLQVARLRARLRDKGILLELTEKAREHLATVGYDPNFGARPLRRAIQRELETPLAKKIVAGEIPEGVKVIADFDGREIQFRTEEVGEELIAAEAAG